MVSGGAPRAVADTAKDLHITLICRLPGAC